MPTVRHLAEIMRDQDGQAGEPPQAIEFDHTAHRVMAPLKGAGTQTSNGPHR